MAAMLSGFAFAVLVLLVSAQPRKAPDTGAVVPDPKYIEQAVEALVLASIGCAVLGFTFAIVAGEHKRTSRPQAMAFYAGTAFVVAIANLLLAVALVARAFVADSPVHTIVAVAITAAYSIALIFLSLSPVYVQSNVGEEDKGPSWEDVKASVRFRRTPLLSAQRRETISQLWRRPWAPFVLRHLFLVAGFALWLTGVRPPLTAVLLLSGVVIYGGALVTLVMSLSPQSQQWERRARGGRIESAIRETMGVVWTYFTSLRRRGSELPAALLTCLVLGLLLTQLPPPGTNAGARTRLGSVAILSPDDDELVCRREALRGSAKRVPESTDLWVVVYATAEGRYVPAGRVDLDDQGAAEWITQLDIGQDDQTDTGKRFELQVLSADAKADRLFSEVWQGAAGSGLEGLPHGAKSLARRSVYREPC